MSRYISFRDFDWVLLLFVLIICGLGVMEIHSATEHTKFAGAHIKQLYWIVGGLGGMFLVSLINYQKLLDGVLWMYIASIAIADVGDGVWTEVSGSAPLGEIARRTALSAVGMGETHFDSGGCEVFRRLASEGTDVA